MVHFFNDSLRELYDPNTPHQRKLELERFNKSIMHVSYDQMVTKSQEHYNKKRSNEGFAKEDFKPVMIFPSNWKWVELQTEEAFKKAGRVLQNCIGSYYTYEKSVSDDEHIFVLLDNKNKGHVAARAHSVAGFDGKYFLAEMRGKQNQDPEQKYFKYCIPFIENVMFSGKNNVLQHYGLVSYQNKIYPRVILEKKIKLELVFKNPKTFPINYKIWKEGPADLISALRGDPRYGHNSRHYMVTDYNRNLFFTLSATRETAAPVEWNETTTEKVAILNRVLKQLHLELQFNNYPDLGIYADTDVVIGDNDLRWRNFKYILVACDENSLTSDEKHESFWELVYPGGEKFVNFDISKTIPDSSVRYFLAKEWITISKYTLPNGEDTGILIRLTDEGIRIAKIHDSGSEKEEDITLKGTGTVKILPALTSNVK